MFEGLSQPGNLPSEAKNILKASNDNGFIFMYNMHNAYNPLFMSFPTSIIPTHPLQNGKKLADHYNEAVYYYQQCALIQNVREDLNKVKTSFIYN